MVKRHISRENKIFTGRITLILLFCTLQIRAQAQDSVSTPRWMDSLFFNFFISSGYSYNPNDPDSGKNNFQVFDINNNTFTIDIMELAIRKDADAAGSTGFRMDLTAGSSVPKVTKSAGLTIGDLDFHQMYFSYVVPAGNGLKLDLGKFITAMGSEVIEGFDGYNSNYTHSFLFGYAIPFTHTGIRGMYRFNSQVSALFMLVNGWDDAIDNNMSKSICEQMSLSPAAGMNISVTHMIGPEKNENDTDYRNSFDVVGSDSVCSKLSIGVNGDFSTEMHSGAGNGTGEWWGIAGYLKYCFSREFGIAIRCERFADVDGLRTGVRQNLRECTLTPELRLTPNVILRSDIRIDGSDQQVFQKGNSWTDTQATLSANAIYTF